jgi:hypothetical protein
MRSVVRLPVLSSGSGPAVPASFGATVAHVSSVLRESLDAEIDAQLEGLAGADLALEPGERARAPSPSRRFPLS